MQNQIKNIIKSVWLVGMVVFLMSSCTYDTVIQPIDVPDVVSFNTDVVPVFSASCSTVGCHNDGGIAPVLTADKAWNNLVNFNYVNIQDPQSSLLYTKIDGGSMEGFATDQDRAIILTWIDQGAENN